MCEKGRKRGRGKQVKCLVSSGCGVIAFSFCFDVCVGGGGGGGSNNISKMDQDLSHPTPLPDTLIMNGPLIVSTLSEGN